jgi:hypothetical protein
LASVSQRTRLGEVVGEGVALVKGGKGSEDGGGRKGSEDGGGRKAALGAYVFSLWALRGTAWHASARTRSLLRTDEGCGCGFVLFVVSGLWGGSGRCAYPRTTEYEGRMFAAAGAMVGRYYLICNRTLTI